MHVIESLGLDLKDEEEMLIEDCEKCGRFLEDCVCDKLLWKEISGEENALEDWREDQVEK